MLQLNFRMKQNLLTCFWAFAMLGVLVPAASWAQQTGSIAGTVKDAEGQPIIGAAVVVQGTTLGSASDVNGLFRIEGAKSGRITLAASYLGYQTFTTVLVVESGKTTRIDMVLMEDVKMLQEAVVIGYGTTQTRDLTGSVTAIQPKSFQQGNFASPEQMIMGKAPGVQITPGSGAPGAGNRIRVRGTTSLAASSEPLIVIDGVPVDSRGIPGAANPFSLINPDDIESFTILKDASAAAIYGSRAAAGVIIITTKKGKASDKLRVQVNSAASIKQINRTVQVLSAQELTDAVIANGDAEQIARLTPGGNTNWQDEIYQLGRISDFNVSFSGGLKKLPYRLGFERYDESGNLSTGSFDRTGVNLNLNPTLLNGRLKIDANAKYFNIQNRFANQGAIGSAITFDPTKPVRVDSGSFDGYYEWTRPNGQPEVLAPKNPVGLLNQRRDLSSVNRFLGSVLFDYNVVEVPGLHLFLNLGGDFTRSSGTVTVDSTSAADFFRPGRFNEYAQNGNNRLVEAYFNYAKELKSITSKFDFTGGYTFQDWSRESPVFPDLTARGDTFSEPNPFPFFTENALMSFFGRLNYTYNDKYLLTATLRADGSSRFAPANRWGFFPSVAFAWRMSDEDFFKRMKNLSNLKMRLGWGMTGQQEIGVDYGYMAFWNQSTPTAHVQLGNDFLYMLRPSGYDANLRWEATTTYNLGFDYGFLNNRIYGALEFYHRDTRDLLNAIPVPAGTNFTNVIVTNVGSMTNTGVEMSLNYVAYDTKDFTWEIGGNATFNRNRITDLFGNETLNEQGILTGGISGGTGNTVQILQIGRPVGTFYTFQQLYDENGKPLEGQYRDVNGDGQITEADLVVSDKFADPQYFFALSSSVRYKNWTGGFTLRGEIGRYVYNNVNSNFGHFDATGVGRTWLSNMTTDYFNTGFMNAQYLSDYYIERADFLRLDNLHIGYNFGNLFNQRVGTRLAFMVQNAFVLSRYSGIDPEVAGGIDNNIYPRARVYTLNLNLTF
jgi:TonB-linked SusC/RagA family outer membrane protein